MKNFVNTADYLINLLLDRYDVYTISELAPKINTTQQTISSWKSRDAVTAIKKKCKELGIYNEIFGDINTSFTQHGSGNQQIGTQNNRDSSNINNISGPSKTQNIDEDILKLVEALSSIANALNKKQELKNELTKLISTLPTL